MRPRCATRPSPSRAPLTWSWSSSACRPWRSPEGFDRTHIDLPAAQLELLDAVVAANANVVVVLSNGGVVALPFVEKVPAILEAWLLGRAGAAARPTYCTASSTIGSPRGDHPAAPRGHPGLRQLPGASTATCATARACSSATAGTTSEASMSPIPSVTASPTRRLRMATPRPRSPRTATSS
nr:glycoside hydrolase family 3 C-terminal domain-containing protein [Tessaracoccus sp.]